MDREKLSKKLNDTACIFVKSKTLRRLTKYEPEVQDFDAKINDLMDSIDFLIDDFNRRNEKDL